MNHVELLESNVRKYPDRDCVRAGGKGYSYRAIDALSKRAAGLFQARGIRKGDRVAIMSQNTISFVTAFFGTLTAGGIVVPINHKLMAPEVDFILENSGSKLFLFDGSLAAVAGQVKADAQKLSMDTPAAFCDGYDASIQTDFSYAPVQIQDEDVAQILYTSGTTGKPKGCLISHDSIVTNGMICALSMKLDEDDRMLIAMPIWHSSPLNNWFAAMQVSGGTIVLLREYHPHFFLQTIQEEKCTAYFGAPISYLMPLQLNDFDAFDLSSMRVWIYGGGPISADTAKMLMARYKSERFHQVYGMTETGPQGTRLQPRDQLRKPGSIGRIGNPGVDVKVMRSSSEQAGPGESGEIWMRSACVMKGYFNNPGATAEAFEAGGWYKTGDIARVDQDGYLYIVDRAKDMIVTGGENVYSKEVEDALSACPGIVEVAVIGTPNADWGETVTAFIVAEPSAGLDAEQVKGFLGDKLAKYKIPRLCHFVDELPHTPTGKVMKYKLREQLRA